MNNITLRVEWCIYNKLASPFHKTLPKSSAFINRISVRFYETDWIKNYTFSLFLQQRRQWWNYNRDTSTFKQFHSEWKVITPSIIKVLSPFQRKRSSHYPPFFNVTVRRRRLMGGEGAIEGFKNVFILDFPFQTYFISY